MLKKAYWHGRLVFRGQLAAIETPEAFEAWVDGLARREWITHAGSTDAFRGTRGREQTVKHRAHYACGVAMSNKRIVSIDDGQVTFIYKDYRHQDDPGSPAPIKTMTMPAVEFIRHFLSHVPENGSRRFRYYGFVAPGRRAKNLERIRQMIGQPNAAGDAEAAGDEPQETGDAVAAQKCPVCGRGERIVVWSRERPRVSEILAMRLADLYDMRLAEWDDY